MDGCQFFRKNVKKGVQKGVVVRIQKWPKIVFFDVFWLFLRGLEKQCFLAVFGDG